MKRSSKIAQWIFTGLFGICALGNIIDVAVNFEIIR